MKVTILGSGAYGTALGLVLNKNKHNTILWTPLEEEVKQIKKEHVSKVLNVEIPKEIKFTTDLSKVKNSDLIVIAVPTKFLNSTTKKLKKYYNIWDKIKVIAKEFKDIDGEKRVVWTQK